MNKKSNLLKNAMADLKISEPLRPHEFTLPKITQDQFLTQSNSDPVKVSQGQNLAESKPARVNSRPSQNLTSCLDSVDPVQSHYTKVPHYLLRRAHFKDPLCFMIYMHMYSLSYGFSKNHCDVSLMQMVKFTGAVKNTVKRALENLLRDGHIRIAEEHSPHKHSRRYEVIFIEGDHPTKKPQDQIPTESNIDPVPVAENTKRTGANFHRVEIEPSQNLIASGSKLDPATGSKSDPLKEIYKNIKELSPELKIYFESLPAGKRRAEEKALEGLAQNYSLEKIQCASLHLKKHGEPRTGNPVHSPMAFLSFAINEVLHLVEKQRAQETQKQSLQIAVSKEALAKAEAHEAIIGIAVRKFHEVISDPELRKSILQPILEKQPFSRFLPKEVAEKEAILEWHKKQLQSA